MSKVARVGALRSLFDGLYICLINLYMELINNYFHSSSVGYLGIEKSSDSLVGSGCCGVILFTKS